MRLCPVCGMPTGELFCSEACQREFYGYTEEDDAAFMAAEIKTMGEEMGDDPEEDDAA